MLDANPFDQPSNPVAFEPDLENWPIAPTCPPVMISGIASNGAHFPIEKIEAHVRDIHHLAISVFLFCGDELLIQRRALSKYHCGGLWANTCCTHPNHGETPTDAAHRRLGEELGISVDLGEKRIVEYAADVGNGLFERERVHMFTAHVDKQQMQILPNPDEVAQTRWITATALAEDIAKSPEKFTPWFRIYLDRFPKLVF